MRRHEAGPDAAGLRLPAVRRERILPARPETRPIAEPRDRDAPAHRLIERARDAFRDVSELSQSRLGRVRTIVREGYSLTSQRTTMVSKDDTSIDGKRILLG